MSTAFVAFGFANGHTFQNQVPHLQDIGFPAVVAATSVQAVGIGSAIGKFGFGWLCDFIPPKYILIIGSILQIVATLILISINSSSTEFLLWVYGILFGLGMGSWLPSLSMTTTYNFGLISYGIIFGIYYMLFNIGGAIGPVVGGYLFDTAGSYNLAFIICLISYGIAIPTMFLVHRPRINNN
jgi:MFS family permease